jgi:hypothetical protein
MCNAQFYKEENMDTTLNDLFGSIDSIFGQDSKTKKSGNTANPNTDIFSDLEDILQLLDLASQKTSNIQNGDDFLSLFQGFDNPRKLAIQFSDRNKRYFCQKYKNGEELLRAFLNNLHNIDPTVKISPNRATIVDFSYILGVPVLVIDRIPWESKITNSLTSDKFFKPGIICLSGLDSDQNIKFELMKIALVWLKKNNVFKVQDVMPSLPPDRQYIKTRRDIVEKVRTLVIAYLVTKPGVLPYMSRDKAIELLTDSKLFEVETIPDNFYHQLSRIVDFIMAVDLGQDKPISRVKLIQILYQNSDCGTITDACNHAINFVV